MGQEKSSEITRKRQELKQTDTDTDTTQGSFASQLQQFFDQNGRYIQYGAIGMGIIGIVVISRSIRMGSKFSNANMIPQEFYEKNVNLYGRLKFIDKEESVLMVEHLPILSLRKWRGQAKSNDGLLRLQIPGLEFNEAIEVLERRNPNASLGRIKFTLLQFNDAKNSALCLVYSRRFLFFKNFGVWCVKNNVANMSSSKLLQELPAHMWNIKALNIYYKPLLKLEQSNKSEPLFRRIWDKLKYFVSRVMSRNR